MLPILPFFVYQRRPSGPAAIPHGEPPARGSAYSLIAPLVSIRPILSAPNSVNQSAPSVPFAMWAVNWWVVSAKREETREKRLAAPGEC